MQFFGARANLAKALLYAINGGVDEVTGKLVAPGLEPITGDVLDYDEVLAKFDGAMDWLARTYVKALNAIHYMHDKYAYERIEMALHDRDISAHEATDRRPVDRCRFAVGDPRQRSTVIRNADGLAVDYDRGRECAFGNNIDSVDDIAVCDRDLHEEWRASPVSTAMRRRPRSRTITSNVVYGDYRQHLDGRRPRFLAPGSTR